jgi:hypothetical protein
VFVAPHRNRATALEASLQSWQSDVPLERRLNETIDLALPIVGALKIDRQALVRRALTIRHYRMHYSVTAARSAWIDGATSSDPLAPMDPRRPFGSPVDSE